ncbi:Mandelate racemase [Sphingobium herbicidovorans NBRC 16415]|uniref:Dipeptide epimerase n=1 Tax=Sphingobium herbicidovorans (strain ATCC 700291 / DSM 11019 / CCUG 56400 / KCTC 2939 / LMG 18315 / NBRC 16415 / MH) TaxID=1219045 RepID=A0A086P7D3_SPHHM|nr:N-acetyl-D-Glu racemase DgcA [Sphingobium herbicidovorans]KFG89301.1 Mandelate racemase [Sphingobium herbicidovorans NBRC 16415]
MTHIISATVERWPVAGAFIISRGAKTWVDVVMCEVGDGEHIGRGEGTAIYYEGETAEGCAAAISAYDGPLNREALLHRMPRGAARNALDCALWDLEAKQAGLPVWQLAGLQAPVPLPTAFTISLNEPAQMEADARAAAAKGFALLKCKLTGDGDRARIAAVRAGSPSARLIVDANESWHDLDVAAEARALAELGVEMVEQPILHGREERLRGVKSQLPLCADESCHTRADLDRLGDFDAVNIKLDKAGGLTEALALAQEARARNFRVMVGCMLGTSLGIAPAALVAQGADWIDLDGALLLARDRDGGLPLKDGLLHPGTLWGMGQ